MAEIESSLAAWLGRIETQVSRIMARLDDLVRLESGHQSAVARIVDLERRVLASESKITEMDKQTPINDLVKRWVLGVIAILAVAVIGALVTLVVRHGDVGTAIGVAKSIAQP